jgi:type VI secretion system secreted protein VgrG
MAEPGSTLYLGRVTDNEDPEARGRVKCQRLDRPDGVVTKWARVMMPFGGTGTGFMMLPEVGDLAVLAHFGEEPIVLGFIYGGQDETASDAVGKRRIKSKDGHTLTFFDGNDSGITIEDASGNLIEMKSDGITIKTSGSLTLEASGTTTVKGATVELNP